LFVFFVFFFKFKLVSNEEGLNIFMPEYKFIVANSIPTIYDPTFALIHLFVEQMLIPKQSSEAAKGTEIFLLFLSFFFQSVDLIFNSFFLQKMPYEKHKYKMQYTLRYVSGSNFKFSPS